MADSIASAPVYVRTRLSFMMFLQYAIWGAWLPILYPFIANYRKFTPGQISAVFAAGAAGAILGPFLAGQLADRRFRTERMLAVSHFVGAGLVWFLAGTAEFWPFVVISAFYGLIYAPTLALTNSLAFAHLPSRDQDFGPVRLWGTIGWIAAGILVGQILLHYHTPAGASAAEVSAAQDAGRAVAFQISAALGVVMMFVAYRVIDVLTPKVDFQEELKRGNVAVGLFVAAIFVSVAIVIGGALN